MGGEYLLEQRRARTRQPENKDRFAARGAVAGALAKKHARAHLLLPCGVLFHQLRAVATRGALERVTALVVAEGARVVRAVLVRLAERKAQMVAVELVGREVRLGRFELCDFRVGESVGLEIGEAPVRITELRPGRDRQLVGLDRRRAPPERLQRVADR